MLSQAAGSGRRGGSGRFSEDCLLQADSPPPPSALTVNHRIKTQSRRKAAFLVFSSFPHLHCMPGREAVQSEVPAASPRWPHTRALQIFAEKGCYKHPLSCSQSSLGVSALFSQCRGKKVQLLTTFAFSSVGTAGFFFFFW